MGKYDDAMYRFLSDNGRFADLFNGAVFRGERVLLADELEGDSERYVMEQPGPTPVGAADSGDVGSAGPGHGTVAKGLAGEVPGTASRGMAGEVPRTTSRYRDIRRRLPVSLWRRRGQ